MLCTVTTSPSTSAHGNSTTSGCHTRSCDGASVSHHPSTTPNITSHAPIHLTHSRRHRTRAATIATTSKTAAGTRSTRTGKSKYNAPTAQTHAISSTNAGTHRIVNFSTLCIIPHPHPIPPSRASPSCNPLTPRLHSPNPPPMLHSAAAGMAKLVDAPDLGSGTERCAGSSPVPGTIPIRKPAPAQSIHATASPSSASHP